MPVNRLAGNAFAITLIGMPAAAADVGDVGTRAQPLRQPVDHRQDDVDQSGVEHLAAHLGHQRVKARIRRCRATRRRGGSSR